MTSATVVIAALAALGLLGWWWTAWTAERARDQFVTLIEDRERALLDLEAQLTAARAAHTVTQNAFVATNRALNALIREQAEAEAIAKSKAALR